MNVIDDTAEQLQTALGAGYDVRDFEDLPDKPAKPTLLVGLVEYVPAVNAEGSLTARFRFTVISPIEDRRKAQAQLDGKTGVPGLFTTTLIALRDAGFVHTRTTPALVKDTYVGFAIEAWTDTASPY